MRRVVFQLYGNGKEKQKHVQKHVKALVEMKELTLGVDFNLDRVESLSGRALVDKLSCIKMTHEKLLS